jgi:hypothetical protein
MAGDVLRAQAVVATTSYAVANPAVPPTLALALPVVPAPMRAPAVPPAVSPARVMLPALPLAWALSPPPVLAATLAHPVTLKRALPRVDEVRS